MTILPPPSPSADSAVPTATPEFGTNVGEKILEQVGALEQAPANDWHNVGRADQVVRLASGAGLLAAAVFAPLTSGWKRGLGTAGAALLLTGAISYCPLWHAARVDTRH